MPAECQACCQALRILTDIDVKEPFMGLSSRREEGEVIKWGSRREASASVFTLRNWGEGSRGENCQHRREEIRPEIYLQMQGDLSAHGWG